MEPHAAATDICRPKEGILYVGIKAYPQNPSDTVVDFSLEFLMGRALDNAMLNIGMKDVARGTVPFIYLSSDLYCGQTDCLNWASGSKISFLKNTMLPSVMEALDVSRHAFSTAWPP